MRSIVRLQVRLHGKNIDTLTAENLMLPRGKTDYIGPRPPCPNRRAGLRLLNRIFPRNSHRVWPLRTRAGPHCHTAIQPKTFGAQTTVYRMRMGWGGSSIPRSARGIPLRRRQTPQRILSARGFPLIADSQDSIYEFSAHRLDASPDGAATSLAAFRGRVLLIVNTASRCGFTPQYAGLEELYRAFKDRGFAVLGFPCRQPRLARSAKEILA